MNVDMPELISCYNIMPRLSPYSFWDFSMA